MHRGEGWVAFINNYDHPPPHFHVTSAEFKAKLDIESLTVLRGRLPPRTLREVVTWAAANQTRLERWWGASETGELTKATL